jgi:hypothetical protein
MADGGSERDFEPSAEKKNELLSALLLADY